MYLYRFYVFFTGIYQNTPGALSVLKSKVPKANVS